MAYLKMILGSLTLAAISDMIAVKYYPQSGSRIAWTFTQVKGTLASFRNTTHKFAEMFCNRPEECKSAIDQFFEVVSDIPQDLVEGFAEFLGNFTNAQKSESQDVGTVQKNLDAAKKGVVDFTQGSMEAKGNEKKAEMIITSLKFSRYDENNLCDLKEGIPPEEYDFV